MLNATHHSSDERNAKSIRRTSEAISGWLFCLPIIIILGLFLFVPIVMALWVSFSDWAGRGNPFFGNVHFVGAGELQASTDHAGTLSERFRNGYEKQRMVYVAGHPVADYALTRLGGDVEPEDS